jgi:membrane protease YdiL (CAAX protease family)
MAPKEFGMGFAISFGLVGLIVLIIDVLGYYKIQSLNSYYFIVIYSFFLFGMKAFVEELIFWLIVFKLTEELLGSWIALGLVALLFGVAHLGNPGAIVWSTLAIVIIGGLLYTAAYMYTRRIWFALGIHMGWNYFQAGIFGMPCSGISHDSLIKPTIQGPVFMTGGNFGIEMSVIAILLCLIVSLFMLKKVIEKKQIIHPVWIRK